MNEIISAICGLDNAMQTLRNITKEAIDTAQQAGFKMLDSLNDILDRNGEKFVTGIKQNMTELFSQVGGKAKESANEVIANAGQTLSITAELAIERAKNATTAVVNETLEKIQQEINMVVDDFIINEMVAAIGTFLFIILLLLFGYLFLHIHIALGCCARSVNVMLKMILILVYPLICVFYGFTVVWFAKMVMKKKSPLHIIAIFIILAPGIYLICYLTCWNRVQLACKRAYEAVSKRLVARKQKVEDLMPPSDTNIVIVTAI